MNPNVPIRYQGGGPVQPARVPPEYDEPALPLSHYFWILKRHKWMLLSFVAVSAIGALIVSSRLTPIYESTVTIDIDRQAPAGIIGQDASRAAANDADQFLTTQIKLVQSDSVLRPTARKFRLLEHEHQLDGEANVPASRAENAPILLKNLKVVRPPNTYLLLISYRSPDPVLAADVANSIANSYLEHTYDVRVRSSSNLASFMERQMEELKVKMEQSGQKLLQFEKELNVINPEEKTSILSARLLQLNTEFTNAQSDRVKREAAVRSVRGGTMEAAQVSSQAESLKRLTDRFNDAQEHFAEVKTHYGVNHPEYKKAAAQVTELQSQLDRTQKSIGQRVEIEYQEALSREDMLRKAVAETKADYDKLNGRSQEYQALKREAEADKKLYDELVRKIREAGINAGFQNSAIRIADPARPALKAVFPDTKLNLVLALLFSSLLGVAIVVGRDAMDTSIREAEEVPRMLNTQVIGVFPRVDSWRRRLRAAPTGERALMHVSDAVDLSSAVFGESVRALRNSILLSGLDRRIRTLLVSSAVPREGKSTIAANLAAAHAEQGKRTLIIDGDLRRPTLHKLFNLPGSFGLSNLLVAGTDWRSAVLPHSSMPNLEVLPAGSLALQASHLVGTGLAQLLEQATEIYDLVILDSPPLLGFAEPLEMASLVDGVVVVARAGETDRKAIASVIGTLQRLRANVIGLVLNEVDTGNSRSYGYYKSYGKYYKS